tara:strand:- start:762 stop:1469 length:708 start_codon:yes stop_codon:yes gene_type:complete
VLILLFVTLTQTVHSQEHDGDGHDHGLAGPTSSVQDAPPAIVPPEVEPGSATEPHSHGDSHHEADESEAEHGEKPHDHATDHGSQIGQNGFLDWIGKFHPLVVHFPIALILAAALAEALTLLTRKSHFRNGARYCLTLGALGAVVAALLGWASAYGATYNESVASVSVLTIHRWLGTITAILSILTLWLSWKTTAGDGIASTRRYQISLFITALFVAFAGHFGAALVFGVDYFNP